MSAVGEEQSRTAINHADVHHHKSDMPRRDSDSVLEVLEFLQGFVLPIMQK